MSEFAARFLNACVVKWWWRCFPNLLVFCLSACVLKLQYAELSGPPKVSGATKKKVFVSPQNNASSNCPVNCCITECKISRWGEAWDKDDDWKFMTNQCQMHFVFHSVGILPSMISRRGGHIVLVNSIQGKLALPFRTTCKNMLQAGGQVSFRNSIYFRFVCISMMSMHRLYYAWPYMEPYRHGHGSLRHRPDTIFIRGLSIKGCSHLRYDFDNWLTT